LEFLILWAYQLFALKCFTPGLQFLLVLRCCFFYLCEVIDWILGFDCPCFTVFCVFGFGLFSVKQCSENNCFTLNKLHPVFGLFLILCRLYTVIRFLIWIVSHVFYTQNFEFVVLSYNAIGG